MTISNGFVFKKSINDISTPDVQDAWGRLHDVTELSVLTKGPIIIGIVDPDWPGDWSGLDDFWF